MALEVAYAASLNVYSTDGGQPYEYVARWKCGDLESLSLFSNKLAALQWLGERVMASDTPPDCRTGMGTAERMHDADLSLKRLGDEG